MPEVLLPEPVTRHSTDGLSSVEARRRLAQDGPNDPVGGKPRSGAVLLLHLPNPLSVILLIAAGISAAVGEAVNAGLIAALVLIGGGIDFYQTYRSQAVIEHLKRSVASTATVMRDGVWQEVDRKTVVRGDVIRLAAGDLVPADSRLLSARDLYLQQASLTGESLPAEKSLSERPDNSSIDARNMVFLGTSVVSGVATAEVLQTGCRTAFGKIAEKVMSSAEDTAFDIGLRRFGSMITRVIFFLVLFVLLVNLAMHRNGFESLLFAVALAVGLTPEFLPMITSVTLARGARRMAEKKVIVKHLSAIQNMGSIDILCSDKTGTLTTGNMKLDHAVDAAGEESPRALELAALNSRLQMGVRSPLDAAILGAAPEPRQAFTKCDEIPFDFERRRLSIVAESDGARLIVCKGAPENLFPLLETCDVGTEVQPLTPDHRSNLQKMYEGFSKNGLRVIAVAYHSVPEKTSYNIADESGLTFAGFLTFTDPLLPDTASTLALLRKDGVQIKILTGDSDLVAAHVCELAGMRVGSVLTGREIDATTDLALGKIAEETEVFARLSPMQKLRILHALKRRGHVVGFVGDGVNDAPSLHSADVGVAAPDAVDVAREAADVVLLKPGLRVLHDGIKEGRRAFGNVMKYLMMGTSSNFGNVLSMAGASLILPFLPMLPTQILLNNFIYDMSQLTIPSDNVDPEYMLKPQHWDLHVIRNFMLFIGPISSVFDFLTFYVLIHFFHAGEREFHAGWFVESLATQTLVLLVIRTMRRPWKSRPSTPLLITVASSVVLGLILPYSPFAAKLGFVALPASYLSFLVAATIFYLFCIEAAKRFVQPGIRRSQPATNRYSAGMSS